MWIYEKKLEYPVKITCPDVKMAKALMAQYGGPDSDLYAHKERVRMARPPHTAEFSAHIPRIPGRALRRSS